MNIEDIPDEVLILVFSNLEPKELAHAALACKRFAFVSRDDEVWRAASQRVYGFLPDIPSDQTWKEWLRTHLRWDKCEGTLQHTLKLHTSTVRGVGFNGNQILGAGHDMKASIWDVKSGSLLVVWNYFPFVCA